MIVFRLSKSKFSRELSGRGAEKAGGRWNSRGVAVVYTSESRALCVAEIAVHTTLGIVPDNFDLVTIEIPDGFLVFEVAEDRLPPDWRSLPFPGRTQETGDAIIRGNKYPVIKVPSAVLPGDFNYLLNPSHPDFSKIRITKVERFSFDERMFLK